MKPKLKHHDKESIREYTAGYLAYLTSYSPRRQKEILLYVEELYQMLLTKQKSNGA